MLVSLLIDHFTVIDGNKAGVDLVLIQLSLSASLIYVKLVGLLLCQLVFFKHNFHMKTNYTIRRFHQNMVNLSLTFKLKAKVLSLQL